MKIETFLNAEKMFGHVHPRVFHAMVESDLIDGYQILEEKDPHFMLTRMEFEFGYCSDYGLRVDMCGIKVLSVNHGTLMYTNGPWIEDLQQYFETFEEKYRAIEQRYAQQGHRYNMAAKSEKDAKRLRELATNYRSRSL